MQAAMTSLKPSRQMLAAAFFLLASIVNVIASYGPEKWPRALLALAIITIYLASMPSADAVKRQRKTFWAFDGIFTYYHSLMLGSLMVIWIWPDLTISWGWRIYMWPVFMTGCAVAVFYAASSEKARLAREALDFTPINTVLAAMVAWLFLAYNGMFFKPALTPAQFTFFTVGLGYLVQPYAPASGPMEQYRVVLLRLAYGSLLAMLVLDLL